MITNRESVSFCAHETSYTLSTYKVYYDLVNLLDDCNMLHYAEQDFIDFLHHVDDYEPVVYFCFNWKVVLYCDITSGDVLSVCDVDDVLHEAICAYENEK